MKLFSLALLLVLAVAVSAQIGPEKDFHFQDGECSRTNHNCNWIVGHWSGFVTSQSTSIRFFGSNDLPIPLVNTPWAQEIDDLFCTDRPYEIPYDCTFGYSEEDNNLYQYCWFGSVDVTICGGLYPNDQVEFVRSDDGLIDYFYPGTQFTTPSFFSTNRISSLENGISFTNLETGVSGCLPYDVASKDLIIGNLWDGFSPIGTCSSSSGNDFGPSPVLPSSCDPFFIPTTTPTTPTTTSTPTTTTTTTPTTTTTSSTTTPTTTTTTTPSTTTTTQTTTTTTQTTTPTTTTTTTTHTTTRSLNPGAEYGCSSIFNGQNAVYGFELARVRPASFPYEGIDYSNSRCTGSKDHNCACVRSSSACNWLVGRWSGVLYAKGYNSFDGTTDDPFYNDPVYPFPLFEEDVRCQWSESATNFECSYYFNEETGYLNSHCWYEQTDGLTYIGSPYSTYAWEQWTEIANLNNGLEVSTSSATFLNVAECIPLDRLDSDTFIAQFPDGFSNNPTCGSNANNSPNTVFDCIDGIESNSNGNNNQFTLNYRNIDASWHDWDASSSLSPLIALSLLLAALLALF